MAAGSQRSNEAVSGQGRSYRLCGDRKANGLVGSLPLRRQSERRSSKYGKVRKGIGWQIAETFKRSG
jgi:hypothetical protein